MIREALVFPAIAVGLSACAGAQGGATQAPVTDTKPSPGASSPTQAPAQSPGPAPTSAPTYTSCSGTQPFCIGLKIVTYQVAGVAVVSPAQAEQLVQFANGIWKTCGVAFQVDSYQAIDPGAESLPSGASVQNGLVQIRQAFSTNTDFLVVLTDSWQSNTVGWTEMPGSGPYGAVIDGDWAVNGGIGGQITFTHELGHYQGLGHVSDTTNLMNPSAVSTALKLDPTSQCSVTTPTNQSDWTAMLR